MHGVLPAWTSCDDGNDLAPSLCMAEHSGICYVPGTGHENNAIYTGGSLKYINSTSQGNAPRQWRPELVLPAHTAARTRGSDDGGSSILHVSILSLSEGRLRC